MRILSALICSSALAFQLTSAVIALDATTLQGDQGAGPINIDMTACLLANKTKRGAPCPEPKVPESGSKAEQVAAHVDRAWYFIDMQDLERARAEADLALALNPDDVNARHLSARISLTMLDLGRAANDLTLALKQAPGDANIQSTHAMLLQFSRANVESLREFQAILVENPDHLFAREQAAQLCMKFGYYEIALANLSFVIERRETTRLLAERAEAFRALGRPQSAAADLSAALRREPERPDLIKARAEAYAAAGLDDLAVQDYSVLLATDGGVPIHVTLDNEWAKLLTGRAFSYVKLRRFEDAANDVVAAVSIGGTQAILRHQVLLRRSGFPEVPLDGHDSPNFRRALIACFGLDACFQAIKKSI